ncbi:unnamed protein product [Calypogeia fissa]
MYMDNDDLTPSTSQQEAFEFINSDQNTQLCLCVVQWLEAQVSEELDYEKKVKVFYPFLTLYKRAFLVSVCVSEDQRETTTEIF